MGRHKVLQYVKSFTEVRLDRQFNGTSRCIRHESTHSGKLLDLLIRATSSGIGHHKDVVIFIKTGQQRLGKGIVRRFPGLYDLLITLFLRNQATLKVLRNLIHRILRLLDHLRLLRRHGHIGNRYGHGCSCRILVSNGLYRIQHFCRRCRAMGIDNFFKDLL